MKTSLSGKVFSRRVAYCSAFLCMALAFAYLEAVLPLNFLIPLPGVKLGLANLAVMMAFFCLSPYDAAAVSFLRVFVFALLFGSPVSFMFSFCGGALAYFSLFLSRPLLRRGAMSFIGASVLSSALHSAGQIAAATFVYGAGALYYLPTLLLVCIPFGAITGFLLNILYPKAEKIINAKRI